jgi:adenosylcobyric acid synthase
VSDAPGKTLMIQGTASSVGKSILVAGLCRLFRQEGLRVAPFKAQNMALNSFATPDGREIGRAQAVQAEAAGIPPSVQMNPILLKPEGNARSQIVVEGRVWGTLSAADYQARKDEFWPVVERNLRALRSEFDLVIIEGAGSPVEVNLKEHDIVNMRVATSCSSPVLLVADIDRGGVFASLVGTMALLEEEERALVAGFVINKFRGDSELFEPGVTFLQERLQRPVLGVVPWVSHLDIAEEDSLELPAAGSATSGESVLDIAVIQLPHIANFDDFGPLQVRTGVGLRYVDDPADLGHPDLLILPGTKTTRESAAFLRETGLATQIYAFAEADGAVLGICGGYQLLGEQIDDPDGVEGAPGSADGLGLLPAVTHFAREKATVQVVARVSASRGLLAGARGATVTGYEIHMGQTLADADPAFSLQGDSRDDGSRQAGEAHRFDGSTSDDGWIVGTYLHGLFANSEAREAMLGALAERKGAALPEMAAPIDPYDRLAGVLRESLNMPLLRKIAGL